MYFGDFETFPTSLDNLLEYTQVYENLSVLSPGG